MVFCPANRRRTNTPTSPLTHIEGDQQADLDRRTDESPRLGLTSKPHPEISSRGPGTWTLNSSQQSTTGQKRRRTQSASEGSSKRPHVQSVEKNQAPSAPHSVKRPDKSPQPESRCPLCSFPCWLCYGARTCEDPPSDCSDDCSGEDQPSDDEPETETSGSMSVTPCSRPSVKRKRRADGLTYLNAKDTHFQQYILEPCGVKISGGIRLSRPECLWHDGIEEDPSAISRVHLTLDQLAAERLSAQFLHYHRRRYDEATLTKFITRWLAPFDDYLAHDGPVAVVPLWRDRWKPGKVGPPAPRQIGYLYDWDIEPDMTYMVALNLFDLTLREALRLPDLDWLLAEPAGLCPYLTFEIKCAEKSGKDSDATNQVAAASVLWLYQRKRLKDELGSSDFSDLQHYSIIINSTHFRVWVAEYDGSVYSIQMIGRGSFEEPAGVLEYVKWSNAIHKWGLGPNARSFKRDVEALYGKRSEQTNSAAIR
ncbi:MAG: hypothetical protein M1837_005494 [Sclerophora amabilis]|nr:MAG: hypothetical protein M1837_005494 [Sclerophora amabilis]